MKAKYGIKWNNGSIKWRTICLLLSMIILFISCDKKLIDLLTGKNIEKLNGNAPLPGYTLLWEDDFDTSTLDLNRWQHKLGVGRESYYRPENVSLDSGSLVFDLKREEYMGKSLTTGGITTTDTYGYGYYEVRAKLGGGYGWHEAFWTTWLSGDSGGPTPNEALEIDCFEHYADYSAHHFTYGTIEWSPYHGNVNRDYITVEEDITTTFNTYGFEYTPDYLNYYFNGELLKTVDLRGVPQHDFYLWLTAVATKADAVDGGKVYFDYVRAYTISQAEYDIRKAPFIDYLDSLRGPQHSDGTDLWVEVEDFVHVNNWTIMRDIDNALTLRGFTSFNANRDSAELTARTGIMVNTPAIYYLWVRARDFDTAPGARKFKVLVNGVESPEIFGDHGVNGYAWEAGGSFALPAGVSLLDLFDSSQYYARVDKILLTTDPNFVPENIGGFSNVQHDDGFLGLDPHGPFGEGNLVVLRIGSGGSPFTLGASHAVFLDEYTVNGNLVRSIPMPVTKAGEHKRLTLSVTSDNSREGYLSRSPDGKYLALTGYDAPPGYANVLASSGSDINRVVGVVDEDGLVNTTTSFTTFSNYEVRSAVTSDGTDIWVTGGSYGIGYVARGNSNLTRVASLTARNVGIFNNQLYSTSTANGLRVNKVGHGLPKTAGQAMEILNGIPLWGNPYGFFMADLDPAVAGLDVLYVAEDGANAISKYSLVSGVWTLTGKVGVAADKYTGLTGQVSAGVVTLYATRKNASAVSGGGEVVKISDNSGYNGTLSGTPQLIITAQNNTLIRGIAFAPH